MASGHLGRTTPPGYRIGWCQLVSSTRSEWSRQKSSTGLGALLLPTIHDLVRHLIKPKSFIYAVIFTDGCRDAASRCDGNAAVKFPCIHFLNHKGHVSQHKDMTRNAELNGTGSVRAWRMLLSLSSTRVLITLPLLLAAFALILHLGSGYPSDVSVSGDIIT